MALSSDTPDSLTAFDRLRELLLNEDRRVLDEIEAEVKRLDSRTGSDEALQLSVARILDGALRDAEVARHKELAQAIAPVVVSTIKREIVNSRDEMVEALYPITGRLVQSYVAHAMRNAMDGMNQKIESGFSLKRWWLRLKASVTGRPYQELLITGYNLARVEEIYLIRRGSGEVIEHWQRNPPDPAKTGRAGRRREGRNPADDRERLVGSFLTALTEFSREAFAADRSTMQTLDLQSHRIFFRDSPAHLLAAKCAGNIPAGAESAVDDIFLGVLQAISRRPSGDERSASNGGTEPVTSLMSGFATDLQARLAVLAEPRGRRPVLALAVLGLAGLVLAGWLGWWSYGNWSNERARAAVEAAIGRDSELQSYPLQVIASDRGRMVRLIGLVPNGLVRDRLIAELGRDLPGTRIGANLQVVPGGETVGLMSRRIEQLERVVDTQGALLKSTEAIVAGYPAASELRTTIVSVTEVVAGLSALQGAFAELQQRLADFPPAAEIRTVFLRSDDLEREISRLASLLATAKDSEALNDRRQGDILSGLSTAFAALRSQLSIAEAELAETSERDGRLAADIETLRRDTSVRDLVAALDARIVELGEALERINSPDRLLREFVVANAVFFSEGTNFRDEPLVKAKLRKLAELIDRSSITSVHIIGFASARGDQEVNAQLSRDRADRVASELVALGVARERLIVRIEPPGAEAPEDQSREFFDRRVEFRAGFLDERR